MKLLIVGLGKMGSLLRTTAEKEGMTVLANVDAMTLDRLTGLETPEMILDFSHPANLSWVASYAAENKVPLVYGTTGLTEEGFDTLNTLSQTVPVFYSPNFSYGIAVMAKLVQVAAALLEEDFDIELTETHHRQKQDAPSGTAKMLLNVLDPTGEKTRTYGREGLPGPRPKNEIGVHSLRGGTEVGEHAVHFFGDDESITITHRAQNRQILVNGALKAARFLADQAPGLYSMEDLLK